MFLKRSEILIKKRAESKICMGQHMIYMQEDIRRY